MSKPSTNRFRAEHGLFFLSGLTALLFEVLWFRRLGLVIGNSAHATAVTLSAFFLGIAMGGVLWGARSRRYSNPLRAYAALELAIALSALLFLGLLRGYRWAYPTLVGLVGEHGFLLAAAQTALAVVALLPATLFMGGTFPIMGQHAIRRDRELGSRGGSLYGTNTIGGAVGVLLAGFVLPSWWGYDITYSVAVGVAASVAVAAFVLSGRRAPPPGWADPSPAGDRSGSRGEPEVAEPIRKHVEFRLIYAMAFFSGLVTLGLELLWIRMFAQVLQNSVYSFAVVLAVLLGALGLGALLSSRLSRLPHDPLRTLALLLALAGVAGALSTHGFYAATGGLSYAGGAEGWSGYVVSVFGLATATLLVPAMLLGTVFPFLLKTLERSGKPPGPVIGRLVLSNSLGAVVGPLLASFVLLEAVGLWVAVTVLAYSYLVIAGALLIWTSPSRKWLAIAPVGGLVVLALAYPPSRLSSPGAAPGERVRAVWEGSLGTVAVVEEADNLRLTLNTYYTLGDTRSLGIERMQAHVPLLLHADPSSVFFLGLGTGITAGAALDHPVTRVVATELVPEVVTAAQEHFRPYTNGLFTDPRALVRATDGRNYLLGVRERFDVIVADLFTPWHSGTGALYSLEHFRIARSRLTEGGVFAQWLALYQLSLEEFLIVARTMLEVFPQVTLWRGNFEPERPVVALVGTDAGALDAEAFRRRARQTLSPNGELGGELGALAGLLYAGNLTAQFDLFRAYPVNTDDRPVIEFLSPVQQREFIARRTPRLVGRELDKLYERLIQEVPPDADPYLAGLRAEERKAVGAGLALYRYRLEKQAGDQGSAARYLEEFYRVVPPALGALVGDSTGPAKPEAGVP